MYIAKWSKESLGFAMHRHVRRVYLFRGGPRLFEMMVSPLVLGDCRVEVLDAQCRRLYLKQPMNLAKAKAFCDKYIGIK